MGADVAEVKLSMTLNGGIGCSIVLMVRKVICSNCKDVESKCRLMIHGSMYNFAHRREGEGVQH